MCPRIARIHSLDSPPGAARQGSLRQFGGHAPTLDHGRQGPAREKPSSYVSQRQGATHIEV